jgi:hypothetical protein
LIELKRHDAVFVMQMRADENRFHPAFLAAVQRALDEVEQADGPAALVTTGTGRFYSNGTVRPPRTRYCPRRSRWRRNCPARTPRQSPR